MKTLTNIERIRIEIEAKENAKKTLTALGLFDYVLASVRADIEITKTKCIKNLRNEGYAISQQRVFDIFETVKQAEIKDRNIALAAKMDTKSKNELNSLEKAKAEAAAKMAALQKEIAEAQAREDELIKIAQMKPPAQRKKTQTKKITKTKQTA